MSPNDSDVVAVGYVTVRDMQLNEWQERVEVLESDIRDGWAVEDAARSVAMAQAGGDAIETLECEIE